MAPPLNTPLLLGLDHSCPWPQEGALSKRRSLVSDFFFEFLALASNVGSSTPPLISRRLEAFYLKKEHRRSILKGNQNTILTRIVSYHRYRYRYAV